MRDSTITSFIIADRNMHLANTIAHALTAQSSRNFLISALVKSQSELSEACSVSPIDIIIADVMLLQSEFFRKFTQHPEFRTRILILTEFDSPVLVSKAFDSGATGFLLKMPSMKKILCAIESLLADRVYVDEQLPSITAFVLQHQKQG